MSAHLYVYFTLHQTEVDDALVRWWHWLDVVEDATGVSGTLMRRPGDDNGVQTWMEVYPDIPDAFVAALDGLWAGSGLQHFVVSGRHAESFIDLDRPGEEA